MLEELNLSEEQKKKLELFILNNTDWTKKQHIEFVEIISIIINTINTK